VPREPTEMPATEPVIRTREGSATVDWAERRGVNLSRNVSIPLYLGQRRGGRGNGIEVEGSRCGVTYF
jgi:hypothetical protein